MAIGDKIDWRAGTIDPTTLQLIASAGAAQGAMYQSLGESVSKAFEKDSEDYIVAAGKAFDKANEFSEDGDNEKSEKQRKKGINLFRKAGEKYNIISGGFYGDSTLRTEEDIYKFYGFDPKNAAKPEPFHKKDPDAKQQDTGFRFYEDDGQPDIIPAGTAAQYVSPTGDVSPLAAPPPSTDSFIGIHGSNFAPWLGKTPWPDPTAPGYRRATYPDMSQRRPPEWLEKLPDFASQAAEAVLEKVSSVWDFISPSRDINSQSPAWETMSNKALDYISPSRDINSQSPSWETMSNKAWDSIKTGAGKAGSFIEGGARNALDFIMNEAESIEAPERSLSPEALSLMNQPAWEADSAPTSPGDYSQFLSPEQNPFNPTLDSLELEQKDPYDKEFRNWYNPSDYR